jgi:hypothetical protein
LTAFCLFSKVAPGVVEVLSNSKCTRVRCAQVKIVNRECVESRKFGPPLSKVETVHEIIL